MTNKVIFFFFKNGFVQSQQISNLYSMVKATTGQGITNNFSSVLCKSHS